MHWCAWPLGILWKVLDVCNWRTFDNRLEGPKTNVNRTDATMSKTKFYSRIPTEKICLYQRYINRAFSLDPTLEFELDDPGLERLFEEAETVACLNKLDLELMRLQYVFADKRLREEYRSRWAVTVVNFEDGGFSPSPWDILSALFTSSHILSGKDSFNPVGEFA